MVIDTASYLNSTLLQTSQRNDQKNSSAESGKTQQNGTSSAMDQVNLGEDGIAVSQVSRTQEGAQAAVEKKAAAPRMDTVEISAEGRAASAALSQTETADAASGYEYEDESLSDYTDTELKQMYCRGEITRQEYENETGETLED